MKPKSTPDPASLRERALRYLARREHSRYELVRKLEAAGYSGGDIHSVLDELEEKNWLSDRRFAESWVADHRAKSGCVRLAHELRQRGVNDVEIDSVLSGHRDYEFKWAREVWEKKFGVQPASASEKVRQIRFLQSRGFTLGTIRRVINISDDAFCT